MPRQQGRQSCVFAVVESRDAAGLLLLQRAIQMRRHDFGGCLDGRIGSEAAGHGEESESGRVVLQGKDGVGVLFGHFVILCSLHDEVAKVCVESGGTGEEGKHTQDSNGRKDPEGDLYSKRPRFRRPHRPFLHLFSRGP